MTLANTQPPLWSIPYQRNPFFTGREDILSRLHQALHAENAVALSHPQGISGLGGIGKTQTALEYAYRYGASYDAVFWVRADSAVALISDYVTLARLLCLREQDEQDKQIIVEAVLRWLRLHTGWLLVFDSMDDLGVVEPFLPKVGLGHTLFTTRARTLGGIAQCLEVEKMRMEVGALLLLRRAYLLPRQAMLEVASTDDREAACEISRVLDGLPLALDQAGAYIKEAPCPLREYLVQYQIRRQNLLQARGDVDQGYPASVATTWSLSLEKIGQTNPAATELLNVCAFLAPDAIPEEIICEGASQLGPVLHPVVTDPVRFDRSLAALLAYSLISRDARDKTLSIHRLVQAVLRDAMQASTVKQWSECVLRMVHATLPVVAYTSWSQWERVLLHVQACAQWIKQEGIYVPEAAEVLQRAGRYLHDRGLFAEAEPLHQRALAIREQILGETHPDTAESVNNLAEAYAGQVKDEQAEPLYQRALAIREQVWGETHPDTAESLHNLAEFYQYQGKYELAESFHQRALAIREQVLGETHPDTAMSLNNLAWLYKSQGKYEQAEPLFQQAIAVRQQLGTEHPDLAASLSDLATLYEHWGKYEQAELLFQQAIAIRQAVLGPDHPDAATSLNNLGALYANQGKYEQAEPLYQQALATRERVLGPSHPDTAQSLNNLGMVYADQGKYEQAEPLYQRALLIKKQMLGNDHPSTATTLNNLARLYLGQGKYEQAESLYQQALAIREQVFGPGHPDTANSLNGLGRFYQAQNKYEQAGLFYKRALRICEQTLGEAHPHTRKVRENYARLLDAMS